MGFTFIQAVAGTFVTGSGAGTCTVTLPSVGAGHLIVFNTSVTFNSAGPPTLVVKDDLNTTYTNSPSPLIQTGPGPADDDSFWATCGYLLSSSSGNRTLTATFTGVTSFEFSVIDALEFAYTGTCTFDKVVSQVGSNAASNPITLPSITPTNTGELLFGGFATYTGSENGSNSPWTTPAGITAEAYILNSASGATASAFLDTTTPDYWTSIILAFASSAPPVAPPVLFRLGHV